MFNASVKELENRVRLQSSVFFVLGVLALLVSSLGDEGTVQILVELLNSFLLVGVGVAGLATVSGYPDKVNLYVTLLAVYGVALATIAAITLATDLILIIFFPNCDENTDTSCAAEKQTAVALISITTAVFVLQSLLIWLFIFTYRTAKLLEEALS